MGEGRNRKRKRKSTRIADDSSLSNNFGIQELPVNKNKSKILNGVEQNQVVILVGETGSGKTTQIPQLLYAKNYRKMVVTQPRRVAAISISKRVAEEMNVKLGTTVGYQIRFEDVSQRDTSIKFVTDGILLRELLNDKNLSKYNVIILDEAHERTLRTDILFGALKEILKKRKKLKLIIMSATLNAGQFAQYFNNAPVISIPGRQHQVSTFYAPEKQSDYVDSAMVTILQIHKKPEPGDILVFLTGQEEIENMEKLLIEQTKDLKSDLKLMVCPIFSSLPSAQQALIFEKTPAGCRKVVLSTNIAETSITISGIRFVVDTGMVKIRGFNPKTGIETLNVSPISRASANQRAGRAGREAPGFCYRLYTEASFNTLDSETIPEIKRCNLASVILLLKSSGIEDIVSFDFMDKPSRQARI